MALVKMLPGILPQYKLSNVKTCSLQSRVSDKSANSLCEMTTTVCQNVCCTCIWPNTITMGQTPPHCAKHYHNVQNTTTVCQTLPQCAKHHYSMPNTTKMCQTPPQCVKYHHHGPTSPQWASRLHRGPTPPQWAKHHHNVPNITTVGQTSPQWAKHHHSGPNTTTVCPPNVHHSG